MPDDTPTPEADAPKAEKTYTPPASQADLDKIVQERVARERAKFADHADLKAKADQFDALQEASKTEAQKMADKLAVAEKAAADATTASLRAEVALAKGLTPTQAKRLIGATREELEADAVLLLADLGEKANIPPRAASQKTTTDSAPGADVEHEFVANLFGRTD